MIFQQVEYLLKYLNAHSALHGPGSDLSARVERQVAAVHKSTMGELAKKLISDVLQPQPEHQSPDEIEEPWFDFRFSFEADTAFVDLHDKEMQVLVAARNELIHHFLPRWQSAVAGDPDIALEYLDAQREATMRIAERLQGWAKSLEMGRKQVAEFWASSEGARQFELEYLRCSRLVVMLGEFAMRAARSDGWALLATAGNLIKRDAPDELEDLRARFGHSSLKGVLLGAELFDVVDEPTNGGGTRTVYRISERYELQISKA